MLNYDYEASVPLSLFHLMVADTLILATSDHNNSPLLTSYVSATTHDMILLATLK
jgi:hypothetical protein